MKGIVRELAPLMESKQRLGAVLLPSIDTPRIMPTAVLREAFEAQGIEGIEVASVADALSRASNLADEGDLICVVGSFMLAEKAIEYFDIEVM